MNGKSWLAASLAAAFVFSASAQTPYTTTPPAGAPPGTPATTSGPAVPAPPSGSNNPAAAGTNAPGAMGKSGSYTGGRLSSFDRKFITTAAQGGMAEVQLGQLAAQKATDPQVKQFAERMVADHSKANDKLKQIAASKNVTLPTDIPAAEKREYDRLSKMSGAQFDREYVSHMVSDHKKDASLFRSAAKSAKDPDVRQFAADTLPTIQEHLAMVQTLSKMARSGSGTKSSS
jgi:putative membrane protein